MWKWYEQRPRHTGYTPKGVADAYTIIGICMTMIVVALAAIMLAGC